MLFSLFAIPYRPERVAKTQEISPLSDFRRCHFWTPQQTFSALLASSAVTSRRRLNCAADFTTRRCKWVALCLRLGRYIASCPAASAISSSPTFWCQLPLRCLCWRFWSSSSRCGASAAGVGETKHCRTEEPSSTSRTCNKGPTHRLMAASTAPIAPMEVRGRCRLMSRAGYA